MMEPFDPASYGPVFENLLDRDRRRPLSVGSPAGADRQALSRLGDDEPFAHTSLVDRDAGRGCLSGCWLLLDDLDASHTISQAIDTAEGSWWHGIMHRREGDYGNAKYWFRRVGEHPLMATLAEHYGSWDPFEFVDRCEQAVRSGVDVDVCLDQQQAEWEALFDWCYHKAIHG